MFLLAEIPPRHRIPPLGLLEGGVHVSVADHLVSKDDEMESMEEKCEPF